MTLGLGNGWRMNNVMVLNEVLGSHKTTCYPLLPYVQVDDAIQPGLIALNWTSLNIEKYLDRIDKALGKIKHPD